MTEKEQEQIALFRYGLIAPILNGQVDNQREYLSEVCSKAHDVPYYGQREFAPKTVSCWLLAYRKEGFEGLKPKRRSDKGWSRTFSREMEEHLLKLRSEARETPVSLFYEKLMEDGEILPNEVSYTTIYRCLKKHGLVGKGPVKSPERKRFVHDTVNALWQGDVSTGPYLNIDGKKLQTFLFAFIDDCSRLVPFAQFFFSEKFVSLKTVFKEALIRRGIPKVIWNCSYPYPAL